MKTIYLKAMVTAIMAIATTISFADTMHSTAAGGNWHEPGTWQEGTVPDADDDVFITGPGEVLVYNTGHECNNLTIEAGALLRNRNAAHRTLNVLGNVENNGTITNAGSWDFTIRIEGDIENYGFWDAYSTRLTGYGNHNLSCGATNSFAGYYFIAEDTTGNLTALTDVTFHNCKLELNGKTVELSTAKGSELRLIKDQVSGVYLEDAVIVGNNNVVYLENGAYLNDVEISDAVLEGKVLVRGNSVFYGNMINQDTLANPGNVSSKLLVYGDLTNNGLITQSAYSFNIYSFGDIVNNGAWENNSLCFAGSTTQNVSCLNDHYFSCYTVEDTSATGNSPINAMTKLSFVGSNLDLNWGQLIGNNNEIYVSGGGKVRESIISNISVGGTFRVYGGVEMNGNIYVKDTLVGRENANTAISIDGNLTNNGVIINTSYSLILSISGDIVNNGEWTTDRVDLSGTSKQYVTQASGKQFEAGQFINIENTSPIEAVTDLNFVDTWLDMGGGEMIFPAKKGLTLRLSGGRIENGTFTMNNGSIYMENNALVLGPTIISDVAVAGKMNLRSANIILEGEIIIQDTLDASDNSNIVFDIDGNITNNGVLQNTSAYYAVARITGNINNNGEWIDINTRLFGTGQHEVSLAQGKEFFGESFQANTGTGITTALTDLSFRDCTVDFNDESLVLMGDISLSDGTVKETNISGNNHFLHMANDAVLVNCTVSDIILTGKVKVKSDNVFTGELLVEDTLMRHSSGNHAITIEGNITNNGVIMNNSSWDLDITSKGNIVNNGFWDCSLLFINGLSEQQVGCLNGNIFAVEHCTIHNKIIAGNNISFFGSTISLYDTIVMQEGGKFSLTSEPGKTAFLYNGGVFIGGNFEYEGNDHAYLGDLTILPDVMFTGNIRIGSDIDFMGSIDVRDTLRNKNNTHVDLNVAGRIVNNGHIADAGSWQLDIFCQGHIINNGTWANHQTELNGVDDQLIYLISAKEITCPVKFRSDITGANLQWKWNGAPLNSPDFTGENAIVLQWEVPVSTNYLGNFKCHSDSDSSRTILIRTGIIIDPLVQLQGPYNGTDMNTNLTQQGMIPLTQPFNMPPWNYGGDETVPSIPTGIVDWVLVELRETPGGPETATAATMVMRRALLLRNDGRIVDPWNQTPELKYDIDINENIYLVVWHRNHLGVMSSTSISDEDSPAYYDFSASAGQAYGGTLAQIDLGNEVYGMIGGDGFIDGQINNADKNDVWVPQAGSTGYLMGDFNLDTQVNNSDKNDIWDPNGGMGSQVPD